MHPVRSRMEMNTFLTTDTMPTVPTGNCRVEIPIVNLSTEFSWGSLCKFEHCNLRFLLLPGIWSRYNCNKVEYSCCIIHNIYSTLSILQSKMLLSSLYITVFHNAISTILLKQTIHTEDYTKSVFLSSPTLTCAALCYRMKKKEASNGCKVSQAVKHLAQSCCQVSALTHIVQQLVTR